MSVTRSLLLSTLFLAAALPALARELPLGPKDVADFQQWKQEVMQKAIAQGNDPQTVRQALGNAEPKERIIELDRKQPEGTSTLDQYLRRVISEDRIREGREKMRIHRAELEAVAAKYDVQPQYIVALWGIETSYGKVTGGYNIFEALATMAWEGRREAFFTDELLKAFEVSRLSGVPPQEMLGSWAGAMGQCQFMPSSYLRFAQDADGNGRADIWHSLPDVFASIANYLHESGWKGDQLWGRPVTLPANLAESSVGREFQRPLKFWQEAGVRRLNGADLPQVAGMEASVIRSAENPRHGYLVYNNFQTLMKWNRSTYFGTAVGTLADAISR